jgi:histidyl-tRNA synthetase
MIQTIRGTRDILPEDIPLWHRIEDVAREAFRRYGFAEIRTPIIEKTELFARGVGESTDIVNKEMYTFVDRAREDRGGESITLRPRIRPRSSGPIFSTRCSPTGHRVS